MYNQYFYGLGSAKSCIRELFEYGLQQAAVVGKENVFDFSLGNPSIPAPPAVNEAAIDIIKNEDSLLVHGYSSAPGFADARDAVAKELAERTYTLRRNFVKDFTLNEQATSKNLQNFIITALLEAALLEDNYFDIEKFIEMLDVEYDEDDLDEMQGVREVYERSKKTLQNKMVIAGYVLYNDRKTNDCYDYTGNHRENESLQRLYDGLITIGYEMSDEERAMMDGTHELYTTEDE